MVVLRGIDENCKQSPREKELDDNEYAGNAEDCVGDEGKEFFVLDKKLDEPDMIEFPVDGGAHGGIGKAVLQKGEDGNGESQGEQEVCEPEQGDKFSVPECQAAAIGKYLPDGESAAVFFFNPAYSTDCGFKNAPSGDGVIQGSSGSLSSLSSCKVIKL